MLLFGVIMILSLGFVLCNMYTAETIRVNGTVVTQAEFRTMRTPPILILIMMAVSAGMIIYSLRRITIDRKTDQHGTEAYGVIADISPSGLRVNGVPQLTAHVLVLQENGSVLELSESIGNNRNRYCTGDFVRVKYLEEDVNILHTIDRETLPPALVQLLNKEFKAYLP